MRYTHVKDVIDAVAATSSRKEKMTLLNDMKGDILVKEIFRSALDPYIIYDVGVPEYEKSVNGMGMHLLNVIKRLNGQLNSGQFGGARLTGVYAERELLKMLVSLEYKDAEVVEMIIKKDLKCGIQWKSANRIWKGLIPS